MMNDKALLNRVERIKNHKNKARSAVMRSPEIVADEHQLKESEVHDENNSSVVMGTIKSTAEKRLEKINYNISANMPIMKN